MATNNKKKQYTGTDYLHEVIQAVRDAKSAGVSGAQNLSQYVNDNTSERGQTYADGAKRDYTDESRRNAQRARDTAAKTAKFQKAENAITSQYTAAWNEMNSKLQKASTSTGITAAGDIGAAATAVQKKATGQLGSSAMTGKSSLKAAVEDQSSKSKIPWTQPVTAQNVKVKTSKDKANEDNAKWASRAMRDAETAMDRAIAGKDSAAYQKAVAQYEKASEAYAESTAKVIQNENAMQAQADYVRRHASEDQGKALAAQRDYASNMTDYFADVETDKDWNKLTAEQKSKYNQISEQYRKKYETLNNLSQANDYYADSTSRITSMDDAAFQNLYTSYQEAKEQAEEYAQQAQRARKQADQYLRTNTGMYNTLTALAEQYQQKADAAQAQADEITGGDSKVAYAIENRGETTTLSSSARKDRDFEKYVELGEKSDWVPELRGAIEGMLHQIGYMDTHSALLKEMTEAEKDTLYYYVGKGDKDSAQQYFTAIEPTLESRRADTMINEGKELVDKHPVLGTAANAFVATVSPVLGLGGVAENAVNAAKGKMSGTYTPPQTNGILQAGSLANKATQMGVSQNLQRNFGISETSANFLSGTIISMANNAAQFGLVGGGLQLNLAGVRNAFANLSGSEAARVAAQEALDQAANSINTWLPLAIMSTGAGIDTIREQLESGSDFGKALLYGGLCGAVEAWTEKIGVDSWVELASKGVKSGLLKGAWSAAGNIDRIKLQNLVKTVIGVSNQALSEGGEEVISNVVDTILDVAINGEDSEFMQYRNNLIAQGYSAAEAERKATIQFYVKNSGESFAGGALSGAVFGVFSIPANLQSNQRIGQAIIDSGTELDLVNDGLSYNTDTEVYQIASAIAKKLDTRNGYQPSAREITQLSVAMSEESQHSPSASITAQQLQDGGSNQLSTFATELQATGAVSGREAIQANTVLMKAMDGEALTGSDIKALHAEIPAVRKILSQKLGTTITTGSAEEVRNAVSRYVRDGNSAKTQAEAQKNARSIIQDAKPYARQAELAETQSEVAALRESAETEAQTRIDAEDAQLDTAAADRAADTTARIAEAADQQVTESKMQASRDTRGNLNYKEFSDQYRTAHPEAGNSEITAAYDKANQAYRNKDTIEIDGHEFTRSEVKELLRVRGVKATDAMVNQMFIDSIMQEQEGGEKPHYSLNDVEDIVQGKPQSMQSEAQNEQKAPQKTEAESQPKDSHTKNQDGTAKTKAESKSSDTGSDTTDTASSTEEAAENSPAPSGKYDKAHPNKVAEWVSKEAEKALHDMGIENAQVTVDYEMDKASNGYYVLKDGKRQIVLNGQLGGTTRKGQVYSAQQNLQFIVAHELGHIVQGVGYTGETNLYTDQILNFYQEDTGTTDAELEAGIQQVMDRYLAAAKRKDSGISLNSSDITWEYARGEYAADRLAEMLGEYNTLRKLARKQNRNLIQKALDMVGGFRGALKTKRDSKAKAGKANGLTWVGIAEIYDEAAGNLEKVLKESMKNAGKMKIQKDGSANIKRYTIDAARGIYVSDEDIQTGIRAVAEMEPVANISGDSFKKGDIDLTTQVAEFFKANGSVVVNEQVGSIVMDRRSAKDDIAHGIGRKKAAAFAAVPDVLRNGKVIDFQENWKNRGYQTAVIAAPINMDGEGYLVGAVIRRESGDARFYVHEVLTTQEGQAPFKTGTDSKAGGKSGGDYPSVVSLLQMVKNVKTDSDSSNRYSLNDEDTSDVRKRTQNEITERYENTVDDILAGEYDSQDSVLMGYTPDILRALGVPSLPVVIGPGHVYSIAKTASEAHADGRFHKGMNYHGMGELAVKTLYEKLASPVAVIASKDIDTKRFPVRSQRSVVEIIDIGSENKSLLAAVEITVDRRVQGTTMDVNVLSSAYEKNAAGLLREAIAQENSGDIGVFYINNETVDMVADKGPIPNGTYHAAVSGIIVHQIPEKVNLKIQNQAQTLQFTDWFGDWQNAPANASKVVNEDGTPKVVYHGTNADFSTFQSEDGTYWFSESQDYAEAMAEERGGTRVEGYYLNLRNPYRAALPANQFSSPNYEAAIIRKAKEGGYDGAIIQNDTDSEYAKDTFYVAFSPNQIKSAEYNVGTFDRDNPDIRYSLNDDGTNYYDYSKSFAEQLEDYKNGKIPERDSLVIGATPEVFQKVGFHALPMTINQTHVAWALNDGKPGNKVRAGHMTENHALGEDLLTQLPEALEHPVAIIQSESKNSTSVVALLEIQHEGDTVVAPVVVDGTGRQNGLLIDSNAVTSVYGRRNAITTLLQNALEAEANNSIGVYYLDAKKAPALLQHARVTLPKDPGTSRGGFIHSIQESSSPVNMKLTSVTESVQFKRWFGDWQNHPANASKVVNEDGTPKVMYHGTSNGGFNVFDPYSSNFGLFGTGSYFTDNQDVAQSYTQKGRGENPQVYAAYLNIRNPIDMDANANVEQWREAAPDAVDYFTDCKTNEDCFRALKEYCQDEMMYNYDAYDYIQSVIVDMGYDGITHIGGGRFNRKDGTRHRVYIVFDSEQVKSATDNIGTFDRDNPDIRYSLNDDETDLPELGENSPSKFSRFTDTYEKGTALVGKSQSVKIASELKKEYSSSVDTQELATRYRQMTSIGKQLGDLNLSLVMNDSVSSSDVGSQYSAVWEELLELGREIADDIIDYASSKEQGDTTVYDYLRDRLTGEKVYVPDKIKQDIATALQCDTWNEARRQYYYVLSRTVNDASKGIEISSLYDSIHEEFPGAVEGGILTRSDQLKAIIDAYDSARDSREITYNPLARNIAERAENRERIAEDIVSRIEQQANNYAKQQFDEYSAAKKAEAARLERQAAYQEKQAKAQQSEGRSGEAAQKQADALREQAAEARLMGQTDEETILEAVHDEGLGGEKAEQKLETTILSPEVIEWAKHSKELDKVVARMLQKKAKREQRQKMSQVRSNTFENSEFFTEAELALDGMKKGNFTYQVKSEAESFGEAAKRLMGETFDRSEIEHQKQDMHEAAGRLDSNYLHWYDALPTKEHWTGTDLDTAMMILNQIRTNDRETGDYRESSKWAKLIQERGTAGGQFIQAFAKWSRTPDGIIAKAVKHLDDTHLGKDINGKAIQRLNEENQQTFQQIGIEEQKNRVLREEYEQLRKEQQTVREMLRDANAKNREADRSNDALYDKIDKELDKIVKLSQEIQTKEFENAKIQDVLDVLDSKVRTLTAKISQLGTENTHVVTERDRLTAQHGYLEQQRSQLEQQIAAGRKEIAFLNAAIDALREKNGVSEISLGEITKELQDILDGLKSDVSDKAAQKGVLRKIVQGLMRTHSAEDIRNLVTKTTNQSLNDRWGRLMGDLLDNVGDSKKERIINDMTRIADMINAAESWQIAVNMGDKNAELKMRNQLIDCIMNACKTRGMKPSRKVEEMMRATFAGQTTEYLNQFARVSLANIADDYQGSSWGQKFSTWQYLAQLLNLRTSLRNVTSNAVFNGIDTGARNLAVPIDKFVSLFTKKRTVGTSLRHGSDKSTLRGATEQAGRAMLEVMLDVDMNNARSKYGEGARRTFKMCQQGIAGAVARNLSRLEMVNGISLNVTDEFFKGAIYQGTINSTAKLVEKGWMTEAEAVEFATQDMLYRTFQDDTLVGTLLNKLHDWGNYVGVGHKRAEANGTYQKGKKVQFYTHDFGLGDLVIKYRGVPGALITRTVEFSPAGYLKALRSCIDLIQSGGTDTHAQRNFVLGVSRATTGSGLIALFWLLAAKGLLKRDDDEEDKNVAAMNRAEGQSGTQLNLSALDRLINGGSTDWESGDKLIDIGFLDPLSSDMTMGTLIYKAMQEDGATIPSAWSVAQGGMMSAAFSDLSMMDTINDAIYAAVYHDENSDLSAGWDFVITASASALSGFLPSLMRQAAQASDNYYRDAYGGGWIEDNVSGDLGAALQQGANQLAMGIPGLRQTLPKKLDPMGNEKVYSPDGSTARNVANALVNPGKYNIYSQTSVSEELGRVRRLTGDASFYPDRNGPNTIIYGDEKVKLTDAQKRQYLQNAGNLFEALAAETMKTDAYKNATNERKAEMLKDVKSYTTYKAKQEFYERLHSTDAGYTPWETDTWSKTEAGMEIGVSFGEMRQILSDTSETNMPSDYDKNGGTISGTRDGKILDYLNDLSYSDKQKLQLYSVLKGSGSESSIQKMQNIMNAGLSFYEASKVKQEHTSIDDQDHSINNTDMNDHDYFTKWLNDEGFSESEIEAINENYPFYNRMRQQTDSILKRLTESGMDYDAAYEVASKVAAIEPEDGEDEVSSAQKYNVILEDYSMSTREKQAAISAIAGEYSLFGQLDEGAAQSMMELYESSGQTSALSANAGTNYSVDGIQYDYTEDQQEAYNQAYIQIMNGISGYAVSTPKIMDDIKDIAANAGKYAALQQSGGNPNLDSSTYGLYRKAQQAMDTGLDVARYCEIKSTCNSFTADKDSSGESVSGSKKKKVVAYLKAQGLTSQQYSFFYSTIMGYK